MVIPQVLKMVTRRERRPVKVRTRRLTIGKRQLMQNAPPSAAPKLTRTYLKIADCCRSDINVE
jgi:hypothetical protein